MAAGKVVTGFSKPYVAKYVNNSGTISYTDAQILARGVEAQIEVESSDANKFYADNITAETVAGQFNGGTLTLTVDGLFQDAEKMILGLDSAGLDGFMGYGDNNAPYLGAGFIVRSMSDGTSYYTPVVLTKIQFSQPSSDAKTQEEDIEYQPQELTATIMRDDSSNRYWKYVGTDYTTEAAAEAALQTKLGYTPITT